ncbi:M23 family metallopeptidase [Nocardia otitidiscaviarum]|uniref:M23 family metallopeptidase n=1 Tax=Nocardia otitidiscaviarum TaxID=1823 RepID=A0A516NGS9_9NOCA|nr:M23 family metallopeptidase [Nocardia otitidiscaviarum]
MVVGRFPERVEEASDGHVGGGFGRGGGVMTVSTEPGAGAELVDETADVPDSSLSVGFDEDDGAGQITATPWTPRRNHAGGTTAPASAPTAPASTSGPSPGTSAATPSAVTPVAGPASLPNAVVAQPGAIVPVAAVTGPDTSVSVAGTPLPEGLGVPRERSSPGLDRDSEADSDADSDAADADRSGIEDALAQLLPALSQALSTPQSPTASAASPHTTDSGTGSGSGISDTTVTGPDDEPVTVGLSPQAERALRILKVLAALYGAREAAAAPTTGLDVATGKTGGTGATAAGHTAASLFQRHAATAFTNLDNRLANYITNLAGANTVDRAQLRHLIRETNVALATLGPDTYTPAGQRKAHQILTRALQYAHQIVGTGQGNSAQTAAHINQLTNQYLYNLAGQNPSSYTGVGGSAGSGRFALPARGTFTSGYGPRWGKHHNGVDIANAIGTPILAAADGVVVAAGPASGFGQWVKIRHSDGTETIYGHVDSYSVQPGQQVSAGQQIARMGNEGRSTGPHLHFEVRQNGSAVDPQRWLAQRGIQVT